MTFSKYSIRTIAIVTAATAMLIGFIVWYFDIPHGNTEKVRSLHGQTASSIFRQLGKPNQDWSFMIGDGSTNEFRIELLNFYPPGVPENHDVEIRECTWEYSRFALTVWFHKPEGKWIVLDTCRYHYNIKF